MTSRNRAVAVVVIQCLFVSSIAAKYLHERVTRPRVWVRAVQYDPELPMRGRYLALSPTVDACGLKMSPPANSQSTSWYQRHEVQLVAREGKLVAQDAEHRLPRGDYQSVIVTDKVPCQHATVSPGIDFFIPEHANSPFPLKPGQELWVELTVPPAGPPRAIQLALNDKGTWRVLKFE